ncbi:right-handed parallel beta-helix repeat-containing protein [Candidatus Sumerlaeota bacterium]
MHRPQRTAKRVALAMLAICLLAAAAQAGQAIDEAKTTVWSGQLTLDKEHVVPAGYALKIEPGTTIRMLKGTYAKITVKGALIAVGEKDKPIRMLAPNPGCWGGITFDGDSSGGKLEYCQFLNARRATIMVEGGSPTIRHCTFTFDQYSDGYIFCRQGARAAIESNTFVWKKYRGRAGVVCESSPAIIRNNDFGNAQVGVQLYGFKPGDPQATITGNNSTQCLAGIFDEETTGSAKWQQAWQSEVITRPDNLAVSRVGKADIVTIRTRGKLGASPEVSETYVVSYDGGKFSIKTVLDKNPKDVSKPKEDVAISFALADGTKVSIEKFSSGLSLIGADGCMDTKAAYAALIADGPAGKQVSWRSPKFQRGHLSYTAADLDGDGVTELLVTTGRWCEGKGQVFIYRQSEK